MYTTAHARTHNTTQRKMKKKDRKVGCMNDDDDDDSSIECGGNIIVDVTQYKTELRKMFNIILKCASFSFLTLLFHPAYPLASINSSQVIFFHISIAFPSAYKHKCTDRI